MRLKSKQEVCHLSFVLCAYFAFCVFSFVIRPLYAQEITILYTGSTHAMVYPCNCPKEPDGGIARRATLIKQLKKTYPDALILDSGNFFAGGLLDEYTQNTQLDMQRTLVNLKAAELMRYDALALSDDEFNFGAEFLEKNIAKTNLTFLSCNIEDAKASPYIIREISGLKIGIIGVTNPYVRQKATGIKFIDPKIAINQAVTELKNKGAAVVILLSNLGESQILNLAEDIKGIDIIIDGYERQTQNGPATKIKDALFLRPSWQARRLGKVSLTIRDNKVADYKAEELRLSEQIADDAEVLSILPRCFSDNNCKKKGYTGKCQNPGSAGSDCLFEKANKISLLIISSEDCLGCDNEALLNFLKGQLPGLTTSYLNYPGRKAKKLVKKFAVTTLPAYFLDTEIEKEKFFDGFKANLEPKGEFYMLKPQFSGFSYFLGRKKIKGKLDLFLSLYDRNTAGLLDTIKEFNPTIHFLVIQREDNFEAANGNLEVEEYLRAVCVHKYYPEIFWDYITCRAKNIGSSWWDDCLGKINADKIRACARTSEGTSLLRENTGLNKELQIMFGPTYLLDNQEIFSTKNTPTKEDFKKILKR